MFDYNSLEARTSEQQVEHVEKVKFAWEHGEHGKAMGNDLPTFAKMIARREAMEQLKTLLAYRKALNNIAESVPLVGDMYSWDIVKWIFAADDCNYLPQFREAGLISEPQGGLITINWFEVKRQLINYDTSVLDEAIVSMMF